MGRLPSLRPEFHLRLIGKTAYAVDRDKHGGVAILSISHENPDSGFDTTMSRLLISSTPRVTMHLTDYVKRGFELTIYLRVCFAGLVGDSFRI